jgi:UDP-N-acetylmuramate--alanine ligase
MFDLTVPRHVHLMPIGGAGIGPLACILARMGHVVSGCDAADSPRMEGLRRAGVEVHIGHDPVHLEGTEVVVASTAIPSHEPELVAARQGGIAVLRRVDALASLCRQRRTLAVAGTHGKTTTTAMLATVLRAAGMAPSFLVGGDVPALGAAAWDDGEWFVVEADESDGTFLELGAEAVVLTSVEADHLDHHGDLDALRRAFSRFLADAPGPRVVCLDDAGAAGVAAGIDCITYGTTGAARYRLRDIELGREAVTFTLTEGSVAHGRIRVPMPGLHNARNAAAAAVVALALGADSDAIVAGLDGFGGVARRYERRGEAAGVTFIDSYDHLPGEVAAVLAAARDGGWRRVVCVFQPHRYTRTAALWRDFAGAFDDADVLAVTDVYAAGQAPLPGVSGKLIVDAVLDARPGRRVAWLPARRDVIAWLLAELRPGDLCLTLGAGDLTTLPDEVLAALAKRT